MLKVNSTLKGVQDAKMINDVTVFVAALHFLIVHLATEIRNPLLTIYYVSEKIVCSPWGPTKPEFWTPKNLRQYRWNWEGFLSGQPWPNFVRVESIFPRVLPLFATNTCVTAVVRRCDDRKCLFCPHFSTVLKILCSVGYCWGVLHLRPINIKRVPFTSNGQVVPSQITPHSGG